VYLLYPVVLVGLSGIAANTSNSHGNKSSSSLRVKGMMMDLM